MRLAATAPARTARRLPRAASMLCSNSVAASSSRCSCAYAYPRTRWTRARNAGGRSGSLRELDELASRRARSGWPARTAASAMRARASCSKLAAWISRNPSAASFSKLVRLVEPARSCGGAAEIEATHHREADVPGRVDRLLHRAEELLRLVDACPGRTGSRRCCSSPSRRSSRRRSARRALDSARRPRARSPTRLRSRNRSRGC